MEHVLLDRYRQASRTRDQKITCLWHAATLLEIGLQRPNLLNVYREDVQPWEEILAKPSPHCAETYCFTFKRRSMRVRFPILPSHTQVVSSRSLTCTAREQLSFRHDRVGSQILWWQSNSTPTPLPHPSKSTNEESTVFSLQVIKPQLSLSLSLPPLIKQ